MAATTGVNPFGRARYEQSRNLSSLQCLIYDAGYFIVFEQFSPHGMAIAECGRSLAHKPFRCNAHNLCNMWCLANSPIDRQPLEIYSFSERQTQRARSFRQKTHKTKTKLEHNIFHFHFINYYYRICETTSIGRLRVNFYDRPFVHENWNLLESIHSHRYLFHASSNKHREAPTNRITLIRALACEWGRRTILRQLAGRRIINSKR